MVIVAGTLAGAGDLNVLLVILAAWAGAVTGDNISYGIGKWAGERTVKRLFRHEKAHRGFDWAEQQLEERGSYIIVIARFIPFGRTAVTFTAGYTRGPSLAPLLPLRRRGRRSLGDVRDDARLPRRQAVRGASVEGRAARARNRVRSRVPGRVGPEAQGEEIRHRPG